MPRLAPFSTPRGSTAPHEVAGRPSTPFVPAWMRGFAEREDVPIALPPAAEPHWSEASLSWESPSEPTPSDPMDAFLHADVDAPTTTEEVVPTIEAFLAAVEEPSLELAALTTTDSLDSFGSLDTLAVDEVAVSETTVGESNTLGSSAAEIEAPVAESNTLESSAAEIEALAKALGEGTKRPTPVQLRAIEDAARFGLDASLVERVGPEPLPEWSDDDFVDIMPAMAMTERAPEVPAGPDPQELADEAASMLEGIAMRVRDRELSLPLFTPGMGDAAVLAAALAALLAAQ